jgi:DNA invertase Pin-like site-specific DNA recombinase
MAKSPSKRRKTNVSTNESLLDQTVTVEYDCRGKRVRKESADAFEAKQLWIKKDGQGLNPKIIRPKQKTKEPILIPAVAYVRKSTKGERADGSQKQEKSLAQQRTEITKLAAGRFKIIEWFEDEGISGWKRGAQRPAFQRMLDQVRGHGAEAIVCDNIDRFSRATIDDVQEDAATLRKAGVRWIVTASNGTTYDLQAGRHNDLGGMVLFTSAVWAAHEFSRNLGRRSALARRNTIDEGKRPGGRIPYGWAADGKHSLKHGDPEKVKVVRWIFDQFANKGRSTNWIANQLNQVKKIAAPMGKQWYVRTISDLLAKPVYVGELVYGLKRNGQFYTTDEKGEVVDLESANGTPGKVWRTKPYQPMVPAATFTKAKRRLAVNSTGRTRRKRVHALSGLLYCSKCGRPLYGARMRDKVIYRCSATQMMGKGACEQWQVREDQILPFLMKMLGEAVSDISELLTTPPPELASPRKGQVQKRQRLQRERDKLAARIDNAIEGLFDISDKQSRRAIDQRIIAMRSELDQFDAELAIEPISKGYNRQELEALSTWWDDFTTKAVSVPVRAKKPGDDLLISFHRDAFAEVYQKNYDSRCQYINVDPMIVNERLRQLGAKVTLSWKTMDRGAKRLYKDRNGKRRNLARRQHVLASGRFQLGQREGKLPLYVLDTKGCLSTCSC